MRVKTILVNQRENSLCGLPKEVNFRGFGNATIAVIAGELRNIFDLGHIVEVRQDFEKRDATVFRIFGTPRARPHRPYKSRSANKVRIEIATAKKASKVARK
jgi:hypothetical protein